MVRLLQTLAAQPDLPIGSLDLLSAQERRQILSDWNDTARTLWPSTTLPLLFEQQVQRTPRCARPGGSGAQPVLSGVEPHAPISWRTI